MAEVKGQIYLITCKINEKQYVGQTRTHMYSKSSNKYVPYGYMKRFAAHKSNTKNYDKFGRCRALNSAMKLYGVENFTIELLEECDLDLLDEAEELYIRELNTLAPNGYNLETGGNRNKVASVETREKQSESRTAFYQSAEGKQFIVNHNYDALPKANKKNNDVKKINKYKNDVLDKVCIYNSSDNHIYMYLFLNGSNSNKNKFRFKYNDNIDEAINRANYVLAAIKQHQTIVKIGEDLKDKIVI